MLPAPLTAQGAIGESVYVNSYRDFGLVSRLVYTRKAICGVGVPPGSRTWHIARITIYSGGSDGNQDSEA
ncbi:hypothetical protein [Bacteroides caecimuris]|uniref:hypothetical protein n=1 Tax=Bacteroides caecimuris TaxID=1796613 RepID=UPI0032209F10